MNEKNKTLSTTVSIEYLQAPNTQRFKLSDCEVVLDVVLL